MPPSRFSQVSRYRNITLSHSKADQRFSELGLASPSSTLTDLGSFLQISSTFPNIIFTKSFQGGLLLLDSKATGKYAKDPPLISLGSHHQQLNEFTICPFQNNRDEILIATSGGGRDSSTQNEILLHKVSGCLSLPSNDTPTSSSSKGRLETRVEKTLHTWSGGGGGGGITKLAFHPTCPSLLLSASSSSGLVNIWHTSYGSTEEPVMSVGSESSSGCWDAKWSFDGKFVGTTSKDGTVNIWDPRASQTEPLAVSVLKGADLRDYKDETDSSSLMAYRPPQHMLPK